MSVTLAVLLVFFLGVGLGIFKYAGHPPPDPTPKRVLVVAQQDAPANPVHKLASLWFKLRART